MLALLLCAACGTPVEWVRKYDGQLPDTEPYDAALLLVRDARTGKPIEGAVIRRHLWGLVGEDGSWAPVRGECRTDSLGLARLRPLAHMWGNLWTIEAAGYATTEVYGHHPHSTVELHRGGVLQARLIGPFGSPVRDAPIEYILSQTGPALAEARTDRQGVVRLEGVEKYDSDLHFRGSPDTHVAATGLFTYSGGARFPPRETYADPGVTFRGHVLLADGSPARGAVIRCGDDSRGAWTVVASDGAFRLDGADPDCGFDIQRNENWTPVRGRYRHGEPIVIRLGRQGSVALHGVTAVAAAASGTVTFERQSDGQVWTALANEPARLPAGRYRATLGDVVSEFVGRSEPFDVPGTGRVDLAVERQPQLEVVWTEPELQNGPTWLHFEESAWSWGSDGPRFIDRKARAALVVERDGACRYFPVEECLDGVRRVVVRMPPLRRLAVADANKAEYGSLRGRVWCLWDDVRVDGDTIATRARGSVAVIVEFAHRERRELWFDIKDEGADPLPPVRVERSVLPPTRILRVDPPPGISSDGVRVEVVAAELPFLWINAIGSADLNPSADEVGESIESPWFRDGTIVRLSIDESGLFPLRSALRGEGPYRVKWPACSLRVRGATDTIYIDGVLNDGDWAWYSKEGGLLVRGLPAGPHDLVARARDGTWYWHRVVLRDGESRTIQVGRNGP